MNFIVVLRDRLGQILTGTNLNLTALSPETFDSWLSEESVIQEPQRGPSDPPTRGHPEPGGGLTSLGKAAFFLVDTAMDVPSFAATESF